MHTIQRARQSVFVEPVLHPGATEPGPVGTIHRSGRFLSRNRFQIIYRVAQGDFILDHLFFDGTLAVQRDHHVFFLSAKAAKSSSSR